MCHLFLKILVVFFLVIGLAAADVIDTYIENFDDRQDDATIDEVDFWRVDEGETSSAITQDATTYDGSGKALELIGAETAVNVSRSATYGDISPCWVEFMVKPGLGAEARDLPTGKITAISFDYTGKIYAASASSWVDTGKTFTPGEWYRVMLELDFSSHLYDIYIEPVAVPMIEFVPAKENLNFIDASISSLSEIGFGGGYSTRGSDDDSYIDEVIVHFVDKLEIISALQILTQKEVSKPITVQLQNSQSELQTAWRDITLELSSGSEGGEFSLDKDDWISITQATLLENAQSITFYYKDSKVGKPIITVNEYPDRGWDDAIQQFKILSEAGSFEVVATSPQVAGEYFTVEIIARDDEGEINELYDGEIELAVNYISPGTGTNQISPDNASGFNKGRLQLQLMYPDCGTIEVMVTDAEDSSKTGQSGDILFIPASFTVSADTPQVVNREFDLEVKALNAQQEKTPNYQGPAGCLVEAVSPEQTDGVLSPATINASDFSAGRASLSTSFNRWGMINIRVHDLAYQQQKGVSGNITFQPDSILVEIAPANSGRDFYYIGESIEVSISLLDKLKNPIPNYQGLVDISSSLGLSVPQGYQFTELEAGKYVFTTSASSAGFYKISVEEAASGLKGESPKIEVKEATLEVISTVAPVGTAEVLIRLVDEENNVIETENELTLTVELQEEYEDDSASSSALQTPVTFVNGIAKVLISDIQAETVYISPQAEFKFKVKKGKITFGKIAKSGIGTLMWREIKD